MTQNPPRLKPMAGAVMDVRVGQSLLIGTVRVTVEKKAGQIARLRVVADEGIVIQRSTNNSL